MSSFPSGISSMKLKVSTFEQDISSASLGSNSIQINEEIKNAFNNQPTGTIFNPSIAVTYSDTVFPSVPEILTPTVIPSYVPKKITPSLSLSDIPDKLTTDASFSIASLVSNTGTGVLSYSSSNASVAIVNSSTGQVTIVGAGTTNITVSLAASADQVYVAATPVSKTLTVSLPTSSVPTWTQRGADIDGEALYDQSGYSVSLSADGSIVAIGAPYNDGNGNSSGHVRVYAWNSSSWVQRGADINGEALYDLSGWSVSLSADGSIVAIGALYNDGNGNSSGHVRVYAWNSSSWVQRGADINGEAASDYSGGSVSLSADGSIVAIGAKYNDGNGNSSGHVRVYAWNSSSWVQRGADINGEAASDYSGGSVSLSADGSIVAIGATGNDGVGNSSGHVRVYAYDGTSSSWVQLGADIDGEAAGDYSGYSVSLSVDGSIVAIGANGNGNWSGHVRVYEYNGTSWVQRGADLDGEAADDESGGSVSLSADGSIVAIGSSYNNNNRGHVRVYVYDGTSSCWVQRGADIDGEADYDDSGYSVSLSADGSIVAIGAIGNDGVGNNTGHVRVYKYE